SLCLAIAHVSWPIKDMKLLDELYPHFFPSASDDNYYDQKKIFGWNIESESTTCLALSPNPYFSPKLGSREIDLVFSMNHHIIRTNQIYLFLININTKYLVVFPLRDKSAG
ncbi:MAG: hypothetical protein EZS28_025139, partial [Streblomastix strix]